MRGKDPVSGTRNRLVIVAAGLALVGLLGHGAARAQQAPFQQKLVAGVEVVGNRTIPTEKILNTVKTRPGKEYAQATVEEDIRTLNSMGAFRNISVNCFSAPGNGKDGWDRVIVRFTITEHPSVVKEVEVKNNRHVKLDDIPELKQIRKGMPLNPSLNKQARIEIEKEHRREGYYFAAVTLEEGSEAKDQRVIFNISEGPLVRVRSIGYQGNETLASSARLNTQIASSKILVPGLRMGGKFSPELVEVDLEKLENYYKVNGYLSIQVSRDLVFSDDRQWVDVTYHIREGARYHVKQVVLDNMLPEMRSRAESIIQLKPGSFYNGGTAKQDTDNLVSLVGYQGFKINVKEVPEFEAEQGQVTVHYQVLDESRQPFRVGTITIEGNKVTKDRVIRRLLTFQPGQVVPWPEIRRSEEALARSTLFDVDPQKGHRPTITVLDNLQDPNSEFKDFIVHVDETYTGSIMLGLGVNSDAGLVGTFVVNERNFDLFRPPTSLADVFEGRAFRGAGQEFRLEAAPGTQVQRYTATFREPYLFDLPYSLTVSGYYYDRIFNEYTEQRVGTRWTLGHNFNPNWSVAGSVRVEGIGVVDVPFGAPPAYTSVEGDHFLVGLRGTVAYDNRNSYLRPTEGGRVEGSYEQVFGDFTFPVLNFSASQYFTVTERRDGSGKNVLAARAQVSWEGSNAPVYERFFAGGSQSLRGFEFRGVGPFVNDFNVGGNFMMMGSLEYQLPVLASDNLYLVGFLDSGTVEQGLKITDYRVSAGFGARIVVPMMGPVPIALDFGFPIVRGPNDREQIFSFYLGVFH